MKKSELKQLIKECINEAKQLSDLYHFTDILSLLKIAEEETLGIYGSVSLTRNKNFPKIDRAIPKECFIVLDGEKLSENYKIKPYQFPGYEDQSEEMVNRPIKNLNRYIKSVCIYENNLDSFIGDHIDDYQDRKDIENLITEKNSMDEMIPQDILDFLNFRFNVKVEVI